MKTSHVAIVCACILVIGFIFWPTIYKYERTRIGGDEYPVKINRVTGEAAYFVAGKWIENREENSLPKVTPKTLNRTELQKLTGNAGFYFGDFSGKLYNGSEWKVTSFIVRVIAKEKDGSILWDRKFREDTSIAPLTTRTFSFSVTGYKDIATHEWSIDSAEGIPPAGYKDPFEEAFEKARAKAREELYGKAKSQE